MLPTKDTKIPNSKSATLTNRIESRRDSDLVSNVDDLASQLASYLWNQLPMARLADESGHRGIEQIVRVASASYDQLLHWQTELKAFAESICRTAIEIRGDGVSEGYFQRLHDDIFAEMLKDLSLPLPHRSFIDYKFADLPPSTAVEVATTHLEQLCIKTIQQLFETLGQLRAKQIVGHVDLAEATCRFTYHRRVAIVEKATDSPQRVERVAFGDPNRIDDHRLNTYDETAIQIQHRRAEHIHHVRNPVWREPEQIQLPIPGKYLQLIEECPDWIRPQLRVLEGALFREERREQDTRIESRPETQLISSQWVRDPAIVLGDFVLAGWGEEAIVGEEERIRTTQSNEQSHNTSRKASRYRAFTITVSILSLGAMLLSGWLMPTLMATLAIGLGVAGMVLTSQASGYALVAQGKSSSSHALIQTLMVGCAVFTIQGLIFAGLYQSQSALILSTLLFGGCLILNRINRKAALSEGYDVHS